MRRIIASAVVAAFLFTAASPILAQRSIKRPQVPRKPAVSTPASAPMSVAGSRGTFADFDTVSAVTDGNGALIRWTMRQESGVGAYQVYRVDAKGSRTAVGQPVLGSSAKSRVATLYGEEYSAYDQEGTANSSYEIEAWSISGSGGVKTGQFAASYQRSASFALQSAQYTQQLREANSSVESIAPTAASSISSPASDPVNQKWVAAQPGAKIAVKSEGLYRVTRAELLAAGFNVDGTNSANWRLFADGLEQPIIVGAGNQYIEFYGKGVDTNESDTHIYYLIADSAAGLRMGTRTFRSSGLTAVAGSSRTTVEKKERTVYLPAIFNGDENNFWGAVVLSSGYTHKITLPNVDVTSSDDVTVTVQLQGYSSTAHDYTVAVNGHPLTGNLTGSFGSHMSRTYTIPASFLVDGVNSILVASTNSSDYSIFDTATVTYPQKYKAYQNQATIFTPGRRKVTLTGFRAPASSTVTIQNATVAQPAASSTVPAGVASGTPGVLRLSAPTYTAGTGGTAIARVTVSRVFGSTGVVGATLTLADGTATGGNSCAAGVDYIFPASSTVTLADGIVAKDVDVTLCGGNIADPNGETFTATLTNPTGGASLATSNIRALDMTFGSPQVISGLAPVQSGTDLGVLVPAYRSGILYAVDESYELQAASVTPNTPSTLSVASNAADMIIISHPSLMSAAQSWATYRQSPTGGGFTVKVVEVNDIYDEFSYGSQSSAAIRSFLNYAYTSWQTQPKYVLLMGDGTYDPRNFEGQAVPLNRIPVKLVDLIYGESGSDEAMADFNGDGLAEIPIGRIPVIDVATANRILDKTIAQETPAQQSFSRGGVFANDAPIGYDFASMNQTLRNDIPGITTATMVARGDAVNNEIPGTLTTLINALNTGPYIVNYAGHGSAGLWGSSSWFTINTIPSLTNPNQSIFTMLTCLNGYFIRTNADSLAETLLKSTGGGASLAWASTTETTPDIQLIMGDQFYKQVNAGNIKRVGDLIKDAKTAIAGGSDVRYSWALLGDPATKIRP